uniref:Uncharacterized protein n=1 Tax=Kalanchoe fedtschenkoi TaxID=63787 RepID=A0A7N0V0V3_KALFE
MDRRRTESPSYTRQWSGGSSSTGSSSPVMSPAHPHSRLASAAGTSTIKRTQNVAAKAAAQRLARVMASQTTDDDDDEDDDLGFRYSAPPPSLPSAYSANVRRNYNNNYNSFASRVNRSPSPALGQNIVENNNSSVRSTSAGRPSVSVRPAPMVPPSRGSLRTPAAIPHIDPPSSGFGRRGFSPSRNEKRQDFGNLKEASALRDKLDMLQEENDVITDKVHHHAFERGHCFSHGKAPRSRI